MRWIAVIVAFTLVATAAVSQTPAGRKPAFVTASVKASAPGSRLRDMSRGNRLALSGAPLRVLLRYAYPDLLVSQFINAPGWIDSDLFDVDARADCEGSISQALMGQLVQSLLEDRFRLKTHMEKREGVDDKHNFDGAGIYNVACRKIPNSKAASTP